jgi:hypothetical protein
MTYLAMLKDLKEHKNTCNPPEKDASETTETLFVGFVAPNSSVSANIYTQPTPLIGFNPSIDGDPLLEILLDLGNEICDFWNDSGAARAEMRADILSYPPYQREALMATLEGSLRAEKPRLKTRQEEARFTQRTNLFFSHNNAKKLAHQLLIRDREKTTG